jgi:hypothetical protein
MSDDGFPARRPLSGGRRASAGDRRRRHLELVTEGWIAELVVLQPRSSQAAGRAAMSLARPADHDPGSDIGARDLA